jgi:predicted permease
MDVKIIFYTLLTYAVMMLLGFFVTKIKLCDATAAKAFGNIASVVTTPLLMIWAFQHDNSSVFKAAFLNIFVASLIIHIVLAIFSALIFRPLRKKGSDGDTRGRLYQYACTFSSCSVLGFPVAYALNGTDGIFYCAAFVAGAILVSNTYGIFLLTNTDTRPNVFGIILAPAILLVAIGVMMFIIGIRIPEPVMVPLGTLGALTYPLATIGLGARLATVPMKEYIKQFEIVVIIVAKMIMIPLAIAAISSVFNLQKNTSLYCVLLASFPTAFDLPTLAKNYKLNTSLATAIPAISLLASVISVPFIVWLAENLLK